MQRSRRPVPDLLIGAFETRLQKHIFNDETIARSALEAMRWPGGPICVFCKADGKAISETLTEGSHRCGSCRRNFDVTIGTFLEGSSVTLCTWIRAAYVFSSNGYRASAFLKLKAETGQSEETIQQLWKSVQRASRGYKGYKHGFGKIVRAEMTVQSPPLWNYLDVKARLIAQGKHQSQNTIESKGTLSAAAPPKESLKTLDRAECLLRLLLASRSQSSTP